MTRRCGVAALGFALACVAAAPAQAANRVTVQGQDTLTWDKPLVDVATGDTVVWTFAGTAQAHNVESTSANWALKSTLALPAPDAEFTFNAVGSYTFRCQVHPDTMTGTVRVSDVELPPPPPPPPPPLSEQAFANDAGADVTPEKVTLDKTRPGLKSVSARRVSGGARVAFKVSEESVVDVVVKRGGRSVKKASFAGTGKGSLTVSGLRAGSYSIQVRATDLAGNRSALRRVRLTVR